jgi:nucleoid-associated protein YgaU
VKALEARLVEGEKASARTAQELAAALAKLPDSLGGSLSVEQAKAEAANAGREYVAAVTEARRQRADTAAAEAAKAAAERLRAAQLTVAVATGAQGVYRLRGEDTLGMVAGRFYGKGNRWTAIYEANRHVLDDPDRLVAGITLVVP